MLEELSTFEVKLNQLALRHGAHPSHQKCITWQLVIKHIQKPSKAWQVNRLKRLAQTTNATEIEDAPWRVFTAHRWLYLYEIEDCRLPTVRKGHVIFKVEIIL